jgi:hypothetical protein
MISGTRFVPNDVRRQIAKVSAIAPGSRATRMLSMEWISLEAKEFRSELARAGFPW